MPAQYKNIKKNDWKIGCEVECFGYDSKISWNKFKRRLRRINCKIEVDSDDSIEADYDDANPSHDESWSMEFKTPALPAVQALKVLKLCFALMQRHGVNTNESCGFHVNFSPVSNSVYKKLNPLKIYVDPLWAKIANAFNRGNNDFCTPPASGWPCYDFAKKFQNGFTVSPLELFEWMEMMSCDGVVSIPAIPDSPDNKSVAINLSYLHSKRTPRSRIEIRAMGNAGYHLRLPEITAYIDQSIGVFKATLCK